MDAANRLPRQSARVGEGGLGAFLGRIVSICEVRLVIVSTLV